MITIIILYVQPRSKLGRDMIRLLREESGRAETLLHDVHVSHDSPSNTGTAQTLVQVQIQVQVQTQVLLYTSTAFQGHASSSNCRAGGI